MQHDTKKIRRLVREFKAAAHERELHREFTLLDQEFARWRAGALSSGELGIIVEEFARGPLRELFQLYNSDLFEMNVAYAVATGILSRDELPTELLAALDQFIEHYQTMQDQGELLTPAERIRQEKRRRRDL